MMGAFSNSELLILALKSLAVLLPACALAWLIRGQAAMSRHLVWRCAFLILLTIPLWQLTKLEWQPNLPSQPILRKIAEPITVHQTIPPVVTNSEKPLPGGMSHGFKLQRISERPRPTAVPLFGLIYLVGLFVVLLRLLVSAFAAGRVYRGSTPFSHAELAGLMAQMGVARVRMRALSPLEAYQSPVTMRWRGPVILVPRDFTSWQEEAQRIALLHELAHIRRGDWVVSSLAWFISAFYWFNPLVWVALGNLRSEAERACDDEVLVMGVVPTVYAEELLQIAKALKTRNSLCFAVPMARNSQVESRIKAILATGGKRLRFSRRLALQSATFAIFLELPLCAFSHFSDFHLSAMPEVVAQNTLSDDQRERTESETYPVPQNLVKAHGFSATLPDGTTVRLAAMGNRASEWPQDFWSPTGTPVQTLVSNVGPSQQISPGSASEEADAKVFGLAMTRPKEGDCSIYLADPIAKASLHVDEDARAMQYLKHGEQFFLTSTLRFHGEAPDHIYAGLGQGPWRKVETISPLSTWSGPAPSLASVRVVQGRVEALVGQSTHVLSSAVPHEGEVRIRFLDASGNTEATMGEMLAFERNPSYRGADVKSVKALVVETRPLRWVDFSGIAMTPKFAMAPTIHWGKSTQTETFQLGEIGGELQGTVEYTQVRSLWRPSAFLTPAGQAWAHYPSPEDANLELQPKAGLVPHTFMLQFQEASSFNDRTQIDSVVEILARGESKWQTAMLSTDQGSYAESTNNTGTKQEKRVTAYVPANCSRMRLTVRASDLPWVTTHRVPLNLHGANGSEMVQVSGDIRRSSVTIHLSGGGEAQTIHTVGDLASSKEDVRLVLVTRSGWAISPTGLSSSDSGHRELTFMADSLDPKTAKAIAPRDIVAVEFQSRAYNLTKTFDLATTP